MPELVVLVPGDPSTLTGGYVYNRKIAAGLVSLGWKVTMQPVDASFPSPTPSALSDARKLLATIPSGQLIVLDGLALGGMPELVESEADRLRLVALIHHPLAAETGLSRAAADAFRQAETQALAAVRRVIVTSRYTARSLAHQYGVTHQRIGIVEPGTDPAPLARGSESRRLALLCVATLTPRKGHAVLFDALALLRDRDWHLTCVGSRQRSVATFESLRHQLDCLGLSSRVELLGEVDDATLEAYYRQADLFVLASIHEGYGMVLTEALAHGLPIVSTLSSAIPETVPTDACLLAPPGDPVALANALRQIFDDAALRSRLKSGARTARKRLRSWNQACVAFHDELETASAR